MSIAQRGTSRAVIWRACGIAALAAVLPAFPPGFAQGASHQHAPSCPAPAADQHLPTVDDVVHLHGEKLGRTNPFGAYDLSPDGGRVAVQIHRPAADVRAHATSSFFWLHADVAVYDTRTSRRLGFLDDAAHGDSWAAPFWAPDGKLIAVTHVGPASLDRQLYVWTGDASAPRRIVPGALATSLRLARVTPNGRAGAYVWIAQDTLLVATIPDETGTLDKDDAMVEWPREWAAATRGEHVEPAISDAHLPPSIPRAHALGAPLTLWRIDARSGARRALVTVRSVRGRYPRDILVARDGRMVAFTPDVRPIDASTGVPPLNRAETELLLVDLRDGRVLHPLPGVHSLVTRWLPGDSTVEVRLAGDTIVQVRRDGSVIRPSPPVISAASRPRSSTNGSAAGSDTRPRIETRVDATGEQLLVRRGASERVIVAVDSAITKLAVCRPWYVRYATQAGDTVYARVTVPPGFDGTHRYPVIVQMYPGTVHTASEAATDTSAYVSQSTVWDPALFAARGYVTLEASIPLHGGGADHAPEFSGDILPAVDSLIAWGVADPDRLGIDGISFGGYGTAMVISQTHRFRAAVTRNGLYDLASMYGQFGPPRRLSDDAGEHLWAAGWGEGGQGHLGVTPYDHWALFGRASPVTHVDSISTPVLIIAGGMDYAAPMEQGEEFFTALDRAGKPVRFVRYAGEDHGNTSAANLRDQLARMTAWFDQWLAPKP
jgi:dipeptidyl aminopeptidase/acylaminoacyl peptidase